MEDSTACIHGSRGQRKPVADRLLSEPRITAEMAKATLSRNPNVDWDARVGDYALVHDAIERTYPDQFKDFNTRMFETVGLAPASESGKRRTERPISRFRRQRSIFRKFGGDRIGNNDVR